MFETDRLPSGWVDRLNAMDYVWVPTAFHRTIFIDGGVEPQKVVVIPEPVDTEFFSPSHAATSKPFVFPLEDPSRPRPFRFLSIFKFEERKAWTVLLEAFLREFAQEESTAGDQEVALYILTAAYHSAADFQERIDTFLDMLAWDARPKHLPPVRLIQSGVPSDRMPALYDGADAFVLPSRGEGWGRPHVEAMSMGLPLIATEWSGPSEYMTHENSYPLRHDSLVTIADGAFAGHRWAQPSVSHLRELMREVVNNPDAAQLKGVRAREDMVSKYCQACVAKIVIDELARIQKITPMPTSIDDTMQTPRARPNKDEL
jgi:glycosyltransferase involved in cell wall biosynthesis